MATSNLQVSPSGLQRQRWRQPVRVECRGGDVTDVAEAWNAYGPERTIFCEGDSWFDKFTPVPTTGTNLLDAIRLPFLSMAVDVSHIGDEASDMVRGQQARQTRAMFDLFEFDAIVLSAGGNDLKNLFIEQFKGLKGAASATAMAALANPTHYRPAILDVIKSIDHFVQMRNSGKKTNRNGRLTPIFVNGYDRFQPRPAGATLFAGTRLGVGPWLYPVMQRAGLNFAQMRQAADAVIDQLNDELSVYCSGQKNVVHIEQRGLLIPASAKSTGPDGDWLDEIHPSPQGFAKLASQRWNVKLAQALGWLPTPADTLAAVSPSETSTAILQA